MPHCSTRGETTTILTQLFQFHIPITFFHLQNKQERICGARVLLSLEAASLTLQGCSTLCVLLMG